MCVEGGKDLTTRHTGVNVRTVANTTNVVLVFHLPRRAKG
jgi:hypothetical protein